MLTALTFVVYAWVILKKKRRRIFKCRLKSKDGEHQRFYKELASSISCETHPLARSAKRFKRALLFVLSTLHIQCRTGTNCISLSYTGCSYMSVHRLDVFTQTIQQTTHWNITLLIGRTSMATVSCRVVAQCSSFSLHLYRLLAWVY